MQLISCTLNLSSSFSLYSSLMIPVFLTSLLALAFISVLAQGAHYRLRTHTDNDPAWHDLQVRSRIYCAVMMLVSKCSLRKLFLIAVAAALLLPALCSLRLLSISEPITPSPHSVSPAMLVQTARDSPLTECSRQQQRQGVVMTMLS
jgi:hypothetical protein